MKVLILGIDGMIGHKIAKSLSRDFVLFGSTRKNITIDSIGLKSCCLVHHDFLIKDFVGVDNIVSKFLND